MLSSHLFFWLPLFLFPFTVPCKIVFAKPEGLETWPYRLSFRFLTRFRSSSYFPMAVWIFCEPPHWYNGLCMKYSLASGSISSQKTAFFLLSAVKTHDSQAYRNMEMTRELISFTFDPRDMFVSLQMGFSIVRAVVACSILERTSGLEHHLKQLLQGT